MQDQASDREKTACRDCREGLGADRREFLFAAGATIVALAAPDFFPSTVQARMVEYTTRKIAKLSQLTQGRAVSFRFPWDHDNCESVLLQLGVPAAGGIGPHQNIVAFNTLCTHMGWPLANDQLNAKVGMAGPCSGHWTTFDLTRYGMVVSGHATQSLPQIVLRLDGDDILASGVLGLMYGFHDNRVKPSE